MTETETRKVQTARCPKCNGVIMVSIFPIDEDSIKEWGELMAIGCLVNTEPFTKDKIIWHDREQCKFQLT